MRTHRVSGHVHSSMRTEIHRKYEEYEGTHKNEKVLSMRTHIYRKEEEVPCSRAP